MTFDANRFLDGLFADPAGQAADEAPAADLDAQNDPYAELIDRLNARCPEDFILTNEGHRLLEAMFDRVEKAVRTGNARLIDRAVAACERAAQQLFDEGATHIPDELIEWRDPEE